MNFEKFKQLCDIDKTAKHYIQDLERDSSWLTDYAQDKEDRQRLIEITVTMNRARWFIGELANGYNEAPSIDIVRCGECKEYGDWLGGKICMRLGSYHGNTKADDFCSYGTTEDCSEVGKE